MISQTLERGKIDVGIYLEDGDGQSKSTIDFDLAKAYVNDLKQLITESDLQDPAWVSALTSLPGVIKTSTEEISQPELDFVITLLDEAAQSAIQFRKNEGAVLKSDLQNSLNHIEKLLEELGPYEQERITAARTRLNLAVTELENKDLQSRIEQELLFYIDKLDVSEEKIRLASHINYFKETMNSTDSCGKKLGFIVQEMGREINTLGSKSSHAIMQRMIVEMKNHLEKIKEQVQNVL